jgi:hypothetical protein
MRNILIFFSGLCLGLSGYLFPSGRPTKYLHFFYILLMLCALPTSSPYTMPLYLHLPRSAIHENPYCAISSVHSATSCLLHVQVFSLLFSRSSICSLPLIWNTKIHTQSELQAKSWLNADIWGEVNIFGTERQQWIFFINAFFSRKPQTTKGLEPISYRGALLLRATA